MVNFAVFIAVGLKVTATREWLKIPPLEIQIYQRRNPKEKPTKYQRKNKII
jgi:hypothetical protein